MRIGIAMAVSLTLLVAGCGGAPTGGGGGGAPPTRGRGVLPGVGTAWDQAPDPNEPVVNQANGPGQPTTPEPPDPRPVDLISRASAGRTQDVRDYFHLHDITVIMQNGVGKPIRAPEDWRGVSGKIWALMGYANPRWWYIPANYTNRVYTYLKDPNTGEHHWIAFSAPPNGTRPTVIPPKLYLTTAPTLENVSIYWNIGRGQATYQNLNDHQTADFHWTVPPSVISQNDTVPLSWDTNLLQAAAANSTATIGAQISRGLFSVSGRGGTIVTHTSDSRTVTLVPEPWPVSLANGTAVRIVYRMSAAWPPILSESGELRVTYTYNVYR